MSPASRVSGEGQYGSGGRSQGGENGERFGEEVAAPRLTEWLDWRWVLFVNVPIGVLIAVLTPLYIGESERHPRRFDIAGALTSTVGMASLVYGFIRAAEDGWRDGLTLAAFGAGLSQRFLPVLGPKPFMLTGSSLVVVGLVWQTLVSPDSSYLGGVLGPMVVFGFGMGLNFVTATVTAVAGVSQHEAGAASGLLNATQQVDGSIGPALLTTVFGSASTDEAEKQLPKFLAEGSAEQKAEFARTGQLPAPWGHEVLAHGISTAFVPAAAMAALAVVISALVIRVRKSDLEALSGTAGPVVG